MHLFWWQVTKQPALHHKNTISAALLNSVGIFGIESSCYELALTLGAGPYLQQYWRQIRSYTSDFKYKLKSKYTRVK